LILDVIVIVSEVERLVLKHCLLCHLLLKLFGEISRHWQC